jgi:hypothetical protein
VPEFVYYGFRLGHYLSITKVIICLQPSVEQQALNGVHFQMGVARSLFRVGGSEAVEVSGNHKPVIDVTLGESDYGPE